MYRKRGLYVWMFLGMLVVSWIPQAVQASDSGSPSDPMNTRKIVKIYVQSQEEINELANIVAPWEVHKDYIITDVTEKVMQQIMDKGFSVEVLFESLQEFMTLYGRPLSQAGPAGLYHSYSEIKTELQQLELAYPQIAKVYDIGDSWEKRDIWAIKISDNVAQEEDEPEVLFIGCHHAREWISVEVPFYLAKYLVENYDTDPLIQSYVDNGEIWIVPMLNPDGHQYTIDVDRLWRKNRRNNGGGSYGVDLNRNYSYMWGGPGSSFNPWSEIYRGPAPFSEPETQAIRDLALSHEFRAIMTYHSYGQLILYPWGYTYDPPPDEPLLSELSLDMADLIQDVHGEVYTPMQASDLYLTSGTTDDWSYGELGTFCFTIELRPQGFFPGFLLPEDEIIPTWEENKPAALYLINWTQLPPPSPDIKANGSDGPVFVTPADTFELTIALDPGGMAGKLCDWWIVIWTPYEPFLIPLGQIPLFNLPEIPLASLTLPEGIYGFIFVLDNTPDGNFGLTWYDYVIVASLSEGIHMEIPSDFEALLKERMEDLIEQ